MWIPDTVAVSAQTGTLTANKLVAHSENVCSLRGGMWTLDSDVTKHGYTALMVKTHGDLHTIVLDYPNKFSKNLCLIVLSQEELLSKFRLIDSDLDTPKFNTWLELVSHSTNKPLNN